MASSTYNLEHLCSAGHDEQPDDAADDARSCHAGIPNLLPTLCHHHPFSSAQTGTNAAADAANDAESTDDAGLHAL